MGPGRELAGPVEHRWYFTAIRGQAWTFTNGMILLSFSNLYTSSHPERENRFSTGRQQH